MTSVEQYAGTLVGNAEQQIKNDISQVTTNSTGKDLLLTNADISNQLGVSTMGKGAAQEIQGFKRGIAQSLGRG